LRFSIAITSFRSEFGKKRGGRFRLPNPLLY
jgi:hypothetical protein